MFHALGPHEQRRVTRRSRGDSRRPPDSHGRLPAASLGSWCIQTGSRRSPQRAAYFQTHFIGLCFNHYYG